MLQNFEQNKPENISIKYFTEKVPQNILMIICKKQIFCGVQFNKKRNFSVKKEIYGFTKMSGNIGDAIKYGKFSFPENYP